MNHVWRVMKPSVTAGYRQTGGTVRTQKRGVGGPSTGSRGNCGGPFSEDLEMGEPGAGHLRPVVPFTGMGKVGCLCGDVPQAPVGEGSPAAGDAVTPAKLLEQ